MCWSHRTTKTRDDRGNISLPADHLAFTSPTFFQTIQRNFNEDFFVVFVLVAIKKKFLKI